MCIAKEYNMRTQKSIIWEHKNKWDLAEERVVWEDCTDRSRSMYKREKEWEQLCFELGIFQLNWNIKVKGLVRDGAGERVNRDQIIKHWFPFGSICSFIIFILWLKYFKISVIFCLKVLGLFRKNRMLNVSKMPI